MNLKSPWGEIIEIQPIKDGVDYVITPLHAGVRLNLSMFSNLSDFSKSLNQKVESFFFFEKDIDLHLVNLDLNLNLVPKKESLSVISKNYPDYFKQNTLSSIVEAPEINSNLENKDLIVAGINLDDGWKIRTQDDREFLSTNYLPNKLISDHEILGDVSNWDSFSEQKISVLDLSEKLNDQIEDQSIKNIILVKSLTKNSYILEVYSGIDHSYLMEINVYHNPEILRILKL